MKGIEIEEWALRVIERAEQCQPNEDARVDLKTKWPDTAAKAARQIAGHANAARGVSILWVIGVDEQQGVIGASQNDLADWWPQVKSQFDGPVPRMMDRVVYRGEKTAVALNFETDQGPYVVKNPAFGTSGGGPVGLEVPWREGTSTRSATHSDLVLLLSPLQKPVLTVEVGKGRGFVNHYLLAQPAGPATAAHYLRVKVVNSGRRTALRCAGYLANVERWSGQSFWETVYADHMRLVWSHNPGVPSLDLLPSVPHWLDVLSTLEGDSRFLLETAPKTPKYMDAFTTPGVYRLTIQVFAEEADPAQAFVLLKWIGNWDKLDVFDEVEWEERKAVDG